MAADAIAFYFAWIDADEDFDITLHAVEDEEIIGFNFEQLEGEFGILSVTIKNPHVGLLKVGRKRWAFLSWFNGAIVEPLFKGRLTAIPSSINKELVTLQFIARPDNFAVLKDVLAERMRVLPYFDPVFISEDKIDDPDVVLEGYTSAWCIDRVTHELTASDLVSDIPTAIEFGIADVPYDSVDINIAQPPVKKVFVRASVKWTQTVAGTGLVLLKNYKVETLAGKGLVDRWPEVDKKLDGGYVVTESRAASLYDTVTDQDFAFWAATPSKQIEMGPVPFAVTLVSSFSASGSDNNGILEQTSSQTTYNILDDRVFLDLSLGYAGDRDCSEIVEFTLEGDTQPLIVDPGDDELILLEINGNDVGLPVEREYEAIPIGLVERRSYFAQLRGQYSLQYLLQLARAVIIIRSRAVRVSFKCSFARATELSLRHSVQLTDPRLPGGVAVGKIVGYTFKSEGGEISGTCTIACCVGYGGAWVAEAGTPTYVEEGYVESDYQVYEGQTLILGADDVAFEPIVQDANDDGLVFPLSELPIVVAPHVVETHAFDLVETQPFITTSMQPDNCGNITNTAITSTLDTGPYNEWLGNTSTTVDFSLKSIKGKFETVYPLTCTKLKIPKQLDLEAS